MIPQSFRKGKILLWFFVILLIIVFIHNEIAWFYRVPTGSMKNTLLVGDVFLVQKCYYDVKTPDWIGVRSTSMGFQIPSLHLFKFNKPEAGDVIIFRYPRDPRYIFVKRVIATGGQKVEIVRKRVYVDGVEQSLPPNGQFLFARSFPPRFPDPTIYPEGAGNRDYYGPEIVPEGELFVLGDNRNNSTDSRFWGTVPEKMVMGKAAMILYSFDSQKEGKNLFKKIRWNRIGRWIY